MITLNGYLIKKADNQFIKEIKTCIFSVLGEYGLAPDENGADADLQDIEANYLKRNGYFGIVYHHEKVVGTLGLYKHDKHLCEIRKVYLLPEIRGKGLGKAIVRFLLEMAREKGYKTVCIETASVLKEAISLYKKFGFIEKPDSPEAERCDKTFYLDL